MHNSLLIKNIKQLVQTEETPLTKPIPGSQLAQLPSIQNAFLLVEGDRIKDFGEMGNCPDRAGQLQDF